MIGDILQPTHLIFLLVVALLVLGPKRLPEAGRALGKGIRDFRGALSGIESEAANMFSDDEPSTAAPEATIVEPAQPKAESGPVAAVATAETEEPVAATAAAAPTVVSSTSRADDSDAS